MDILEELRNDVRNIERAFEAFGALVIAAIITVITTQVGLSAGWIDTFPAWAEFYGTWLNYTCVMLAVFQRNWQWPFGILAVVFLGYVFWNANLLASFALTVGYFLPIQILGWYRWMHGGPGKGELVVSTLNNSHRLAAIGACVCSWFVVVWVDRYFGGSMSSWDSAIFAISIVAQVLLNEKKLEAWVLWIAVNVLSVYVYGTTGLYLLAVQYTLFLINAGYGLWTWKNSLSKSQEP